MFSLFSRYDVGTHWNEVITKSFLPLSLFQWNEHVEINRFSCRLSCTWVTIIYCLCYASDSLSWDVSLEYIAKLIVAWLYIDCCAPHYCYIYVKHEERAWCFTWCLVAVKVLCPFLAVPWVGLQFVIVTFSSSYSSIPFCYIRVIVAHACLVYSKTCVKRPLSKRPKLVFKADYRLIQAKNIAEFSRSILQ